jgi:GNAT superfamily N-acetyltransferase
VVSPTPDQGDYGSVGEYPFVLRLGMPGDLEIVSGLVREAVTWLRTKGTDQWAQLWPDPAGHRERILNDLLKAKTWIVWDGTTAAATITIDIDEPLDLNDQPVWPVQEDREPALYVRRVIVSRRYAGMKLGAGLLDWAAEVAQREHGAAVLRIDVWTTNLNLHAYYQRRSFTQRKSREPREILDYPSQALFERKAETRITNYKTLFIEESGRS